MRQTRKRAVVLVIFTGVVMAAALSLPVFAQEYAKDKMCQVCHNLAQGANDPVTPVWKGTLHATAEGEGPRYNYRDEKGVGCQACHGPGAEHMKAHTPEERVATTGNPLNIETREGKLSLCGRCHGQYEEGFIEDYTYGENILDKITLTEPTGGKLEQLNEMKDSLHFTAPNGPVCIDCHTGHKGLDENLKPQLRMPINELCTSCHSPDNAEQRSCTEEQPPDSTCSQCHMPNKTHGVKMEFEDGEEEAAEE